MIRRSLAIPLHRAVHSGAPILVQGPQRSGKTCLLRSEFPKLRYISLKDSSARTEARQDPERFVARLRRVAILDDVQRAPELVQYYARAEHPGPMLLASSRKLRLPLTTLTLYHPTHAEMSGRLPVALDMLGRFVPAPGGQSRAMADWPIADSFTEGQLTGLVQPRDLDRFERFARRAWERSGEVLDQQALARMAGVSRTTAVRWLAALDACFLTLRLEPCDFHFGRRLIRSPKLHFFHSERFESTVISEIYRNAVHTGTVPDLRYWRDSNRMEVALVCQFPGAPPMPVSIVERPTPVDYARLQRWMGMAGIRSAAMVSRSSDQERWGPILRYSLDQL